MFGLTAEPRSVSFRAEAHLRLLVPAPYEIVQRTKIPPPVQCDGDWTLDRSFAGDLDSYRIVFAFA
jgi:hypothetical protein